MPAAEVMSRQERKLEIYEEIYEGVLEEIGGAVCRCTFGGAEEDGCTCGALRVVDLADEIAWQRAEAKTKTEFERSA